MRYYYYYYYYYCNWMSSTTLLKFHILKWGVSGTDSVLSMRQRAYIHICTHERKLILNWVNALLSFSWELRQRLSSKRQALKMLYSNNREQKVKLECRRNSTKCLLHSNVTSCSKKYWTLRGAIVVSISLELNHPTHRSLVAVGRQTNLEKAFPVVPPWNLKAVTFVRVGLLGLRPLTSRTKRERMQLPPLLQTRKCSFLACLPFVSTHVRCYKRAPLFSFHIHFPFEVFILHFTSNYKKVYRLHAGKKRV